MAAGTMRGTCSVNGECVAKCWPYSSGQAMMASWRRRYFRRQISLMRTSAARASDSNDKSQRS